MAMRLCGAGGAAAAMLAIAACSETPPRNPDVDRVDVVASGLVIPWSLALAPDGRLFVAERPGRIRVVSRDSLEREPWATLHVVDQTDRGWETGLMGLALDPQFAESPYVYVCYTGYTPDHSPVNRVARLREVEGRGTDMQTLVDSIPAGPYHNGCRVKFGPDGKLYVTTGDAYKNAPAQDSASLAGKVLRINADGSIPPDNPFPRSPVWSLGHRNPQGIDWDPRTHIAVITEHGSDLIDEINVLQRGGNYGWPDARGRAGYTRFVDPALVFHVAPAGAAFVASRGAGDTSRMVVATLGGERLLQLAVSGHDVRLERDSVVVGYGRLRDVIASPDGSIYVAVSNRDNRGRPRHGDDRVLHIWLRR